MGWNREDWKNLVRTVAPTVATALGGPLTGAAVAAVSNAVLGKPDGTEEEVALAVASGGADALAKLKEAENAFVIKMKELDIDVEKIHAADRDSARDREAATGDSLTPRVLACIVTMGFFGVLGYLLIQGMPQSGGDALLVMLGALGGAWASIVSYYFGSSAGSAAKTSILAKGGK